MEKKRLLQFWCHFPWSIIFSPSIIIFILSSLKVKSYIVIVISLQWWAILFVEFLVTILKLFSWGLLKFIVRSKMYRYKIVSWVLWIDQFFFFSKGKIILFFFSLYISNLIYRCDKWSKYWWMLYLFHLNLRKLSFLCMQTQFIGLILTYEKWAMGAFWGIIFCFGISTSLSSFVWFYTCL